MGTVQLDKEERGDSGEESENETVPVRTIL